MKVSVIVPCYNEELVIEILYNRLINVLSNYNDYEIIFINDGSYDNTEYIINKYRKENNNIKLFSFSRNFGHQSAVSCGILNASGDIAIIIDADLQDPPELIPSMIEEHINSKANVIYACRTSREGESFIKKITANLFYRLVNLLSDVKFPLDTGDFRLIDRNVINAYKQFKEKPKYIRGLISWMGFKQKPFLYNRKPREAGKTKYTYKKMFNLALTAVISFSTKPLRISLILGILSMVLALILSLYVFIKYFFFNSDIIKGWSSIMITVIFMGGVQLLSLSVISEYLAKIYEQIKNRPEFIIKNSEDENYEK
ncbi:glycosyltransferase family 2 protein [Brachyspira murdochii]|uniref:Glycosyltransferase n=1 Tax=Brachyspira murdochii TaxID=84378 RepID=A0ABX5B3A5_9SPIR|nr:glycosyltransferase family 2 protein [Brachyspira murdochii]PPS21770.1 glycosyltransferase [Brachyspira murdochii]